MGKPASPQEVIALVEKRVRSMSRLLKRLSRIDLRQWDREDVKKLLLLLRVLADRLTDFCIETEMWLNIDVEEYYM